MGERKQRLGMRRLVAFEHDWLPAVATLANIGIQFDAAEEWHVKLQRGALAAALGEDVNLLMAVRADEVAHVLYDAKDVHLHLPEHLDGFARVLQRNVARRSDHDGASQRHGLDQRDHNIARARRQIHNEVVEQSPLHLAEKLLDDGMQHGTTPNQRLIAGAKKTDRHHLQAVTLRRENAV